ncbi:unnamed protein product, partial [Rotaria magnacalcarata]
FLSFYVCTGTTCLVEFHIDVAYLSIS